ncbi:unnamed protein product [Heligmosomoides polygyrus]|uniref:Transmembrane protein 179 n=1 Tax=Heligmosomoides polygyrus TaxID=6339 RepID=A0A183F523_HELPZ|nr:unnamed protein product [Heligmosomoides polygyrus]
MINVLITTALVACGLGLIVLIFVTFCELPMEAHLCFVLLDLLVAVSAVVALMFCTYILGEWRRIIQHCPPLQRHLGRVFSSLRGDSFSQKVRDPNMISQQYFNQLNKTWEAT